MDVEDPPGERGQDPRPDDAHVAREHDDLRLDGRQGLLERGIVAARHERGVEPLLSSPVQRGTGPVREDEHDRAGETSPFAGRRKRPEVRARSRDADRDPGGATHAAPPRGPST